MSSELERRFVPRPRSDVRLVEIGSEAVLVDGVERVLVLNHTGALIWRCFDGMASLAEVSATLAERAGADFEEVLRDVVRFTRRVCTDTVLEESLATSHDDLPFTFVPVEPVGVGSIVADVEGVDGLGRPASLRKFGRRQLLVVKWNPSCGYCAAIARELHGLRSDLAERGVEMVMGCFGEVESGRRVADSTAETTGVTLPMLFAPAELDPFPGIGTPSAYSLDADGLVVSAPAFGSVEVSDLARSIAGRAARPSTRSKVDQHGRDVRYLTRQGGMCPVDGPPDRGHWAATRVYRLNACHVGIRVDAEPTGIVLDQLFHGARVDDPEAGHSFSVAMSGILGQNENGGSAPRGRPKPIGILAANGHGVLLRTRDTRRLMLALLSHLDEALLGEDYLLDPVSPTGPAKVRALAVVADHEAAILPVEVAGFGPRLQPLLAQAGVSAVDVVYPTVDLDAAELIVPHHVVPHDAGVIAGLSLPARSAAEGPTPPPGRYPIRSWSIQRLGHHLTDLTPVEAAVGAMSTVFGVVDIDEWLHRLASMFASERVRGVGIDCDSEQRLREAIEAAVGRRPERAGRR